MLNHFKIPPRGTSTQFLPEDMKVLSGNTDNQGACSLAVENTDE